MEYKLYLSYTKPKECNSSLSLKQGMANTVRKLQERFVVVPAARKDTKSPSPHCRCHLQFLFNNTNATRGGLHISLTPDLKQRNMNSRFFYVVPLILLLFDFGEGCDESGVAMPSLSGKYSSSSTLMRRGSTGVVREDSGVLFFDVVSPGDDSAVCKIII